MTQVEGLEAGHTDQDEASIKEGLVGWNWNSLRFKFIPKVAIVAPQSLLIQLIPLLPMKTNSFESIGLEIIVVTVPTF